MKIGAFLVLSVLVFLALPVLSVPPTSGPLSFPLACAQSDCALLTGAPQTSGMRSGFVRLEPGESVGAHSTNANEESLIILRGKAQVEVVGQSPMPVSANMLVYIPPRSEHNVKNVGDAVLEYVYVVSPAAEKP